jgi:hypothetical protein
MLMNELVSNLTFVNFSKTEFTIINEFLVLYIFFQ